MASKPNRSALPETTPRKKASPATPTRISKLGGRASPKTESDSTSTLHNSSRLSIERPASRSSSSRPSLDTPQKSSATKALVDRRSPRLSTPPEKNHAAKESENQVKVNDLQEELKKAREQLALVETEKAQVVSELENAQKIAYAANEKLREALLAQKRAEEDSEIEKFRALEIEQVGTEITQKKEEEWMKEIETIKSQHALDVAALLSTTLELQSLKEELSMTSDAKNQAMHHADDATKIAEHHAERAENLSTTINGLKALLDSKVESEANASRMVTVLKSEVEVLKQELKEAVSLKEKIAHHAALIEQTNVELEAAKMAEAYAYSLVKECNYKIERLVEEASQYERCASEELKTVAKQLKDTESLLRESESNESCLKEKIHVLEVSLEKQKEMFEESELLAAASKEEAIQLSETIVSLKSELHITQEEKLQALSNEKLAASEIEKLVEETNRLVRDLEVAKDEDDKSRKAMDSLAEALHEVSSEASEAKQDLQSREAEIKKLKNQIEDLNTSIEAAKENYEGMLDDSKHEISVLARKLEQSNNALENSKAEWAQKDDQFAENLKHLKNEKSFADTEIQRLEKALKEAEGEALTEKEEANRLSISLKKAESEMIDLHDSLSETKAASARLEESLLDKETELKIAIKKCEELQNQEAVYLYKIEELSSSLREASAKKMAEENNHLSDSDKDYDLLPNVVEFYVENGNGKGREAAIKVELPSPEPHKYKKVENKLGTNNHLLENQNGDLLETDDNRKFMMWESCKIDEKDYLSSRETEHESFTEETDSKAEGSDSFDQIGDTTESLDGGGSTSPSKRPKKKKPLLSKFGSLLKKKGSPSIQK